MMLNPILSFSAIRRMRSFRTMLIVIAYVTALLLAALTMLSGFIRDDLYLNMMQRGPLCHALLLAAQFLMLVLIAPAMTSGAIAGERERQTLELLLVTNTRSMRIVTGKVMESFAMLALLVVAGFPVVCLTMMAGAVTLLQILEGELFLLAMAFAAVCVGVFASSLSRSSMTGGILSYLLIFGIAVVTTLPLFLNYGQNVTDIVYDAQKFAALTPGGAMKMIFPLLFINPGYALAALLQGQTNFLGDVLQYQDMGRILCGFKLMDKAGGEIVALISTGAIVLLGLILMLLAALILRRTGLKGSGKRN